MARHSARLSDARDDVVDGLAHGVQVGKVFVVEGEADGALTDVLLERLDELDERERVGAEVVGEAGLAGDRALVDLEDPWATTLGSPLLNRKPARVRLFARGLEEDPGWRKVFERDGVLVFRKLSR